MTFGEFISNLIIGPLKLIFEFIFSIANSFLDNPGLSIIALSIGMNFLVLPLYKRADEMQNEERIKEQRVKPLADHIKKSFSGDERFMLLQTHYRQNNYSPLGILKSSISLLLQIPFFLAAYQMLSNMTLLNGVSFGLINDLSKPDALVKIGELNINILPILMTAINVISGIIYTRGMSARNKIQLYGMAGIFLVLLYNSPAGLVFYWTLNNVFSLVKNIFYKLRNPKSVLYSIFAICGIIVTILIADYEFYDNDQIYISVAFIIALIAPIFTLLLKKVSKDKKKERKPSKLPQMPLANKSSFIMGCLVMTLLTGLLIPSNLIKSSPEEFINIFNPSNPSLYLFSSFSLAAGIFLIWFNVFYMLASDKGKKIMEILMLSLVGSSFLSFFVFGKDDVDMSAKLVYHKIIFYPPAIVAISIISTILISLLLYLLWRRKNKAIKPIYSILTFTLITISIFNVYSINRTVTPKLEQLETNISQEFATIPLSKNGKNVVVLMMDRAISSYVPYIFNEKPELVAKYDGFTFYPNTISYGGATNYGSPGLYGGYEYTPKEINKRADESLEEKQNESLKVMPVLFNQNGYNVTVCDPSYAGYEWIPDLTIYDDYPEIRRFNTFGKFIDNKEENIETDKHVKKRNVFCFSLFKAAPHFLKTILYDEGTYNDPGFSVSQTVINNTKAKGISNSFMNAYSVLQSLPEMTIIDETSNENTFLMMSNDTTHNPMLLQEPMYEPKAVVDNTEFYQDKNRFTADGKTLVFDDVFCIAHYEIDMAAMIKLSEWFDYLRENDVYDNTRIIIVSDHGFDLRQREDMLLDGEHDIMQYNAFLMVKDFNSKGFTVDNSFMTNCDTPTIALKDLIENPVNPFTQKPINNEAKNDKLHYVYRQGDWNINRNNGNIFEPEQWLTVEDDVFDMRKWKYVS